MWETIKNDPILKTVTVIVLSVLGFGFAFNIMFGSGNGMGSGMESGEMGGGAGSSLGNTFSYVFILAFKLLIIALIVFALIAVVKYARKHLLGGDKVKIIDTVKKDPILKGTAIIVLLVLAVGLIYLLFSEIFGFRYGYGMSENAAMYGGYGYNMMGNSGFGLAGFLAVLLRILLVLSVVGVIVGLAMYIKQNYSKEIISRISSVKTGNKPVVKCAGCNAEISEEYEFCPSCGKKTREVCSSCGTELQAEWKCCPGCGTDVEGKRG